MPGFFVNDIPSARDFYETKLGFETLFTNGPADAPVFVLLSRDGLELSLMLDRSGQKAGHSGCYFKLTGVDALYAELLAKGVTMEHPLRTEEYGIREFMICDPSGNTINFGEPVE